MRAIADPAYVEARNALIPAAISFADAETRGQQTDEAYPRLWTRIYCDQMTVLASKAGLV